jgi:hypothetical protein
MSRLHRGRKLLREKLADYARELGYTTDGGKASKKISGELPDGKTAKNSLNNAAEEDES